MFYLILCLLLIFTAWTGVAKAAVDRLEILERRLVAEGAAFGASGAYEKIRGRAWFALDPHAAANAAIADLVLAPRDVRGLVTFGAEFLMLRPAEPARGNGTLLYEVNNRGNIAILAQLDAAPGGNDPLDGGRFRQRFFATARLYTAVVGLDLGRHRRCPGETADFRAADRDAIRQPDHRRGRLRATGGPAGKDRGVHRDSGGSLRLCRGRGARCGADRSGTARRPTAGNCENDAFELVH